MTTLNQKEQVLNHLIEFESITQNEAKDLYAIARLASRIDELRKDGYAIKTVMVKGRNKFGQKVSWAEYQFKGRAHV